MTAPHGAPKKISKAVITRSVDKRLRCVLALACVGRPFGVFRPQAVGMLPHGRGLSQRTRSKMRNRRMISLSPFNGVDVAGGPMRGVPASVLLYS